MARTARPYRKLTTDEVIRRHQTFKNSRKSQSFAYAYEDELFHRASYLDDEGALAYLEVVLAPFMDSTV